MKSAEHDCHKYKRNNIEWSPYAGVWIHWRWLLARVYKYLMGKIRDPRNLIRDCWLWSVKHPQVITMDKLRTKLYTCKQNLELLEKTAHISKCSSSKVWFQRLRDMAIHTMPLKLQELCRRKEFARNGGGSMDPRVSLKEASPSGLKCQQQMGVIPNIRQKVACWKQSALSF
jgi:hypothetical protein